MILSVENLQVAYGRVAAVKGVSLELEPGEALAILGPNGAGKTSTVEAVAGLLPKASGKVVLSGEDITRLPADRVVRRGLALVSQERDLFWDFSVEETLLAAAPAAGQRRARSLDEIYDLFPKLAERRRQATGTLSGGEQQMLAIGRALITRPDVLLLDEPSAGLAVGIVGSMVEALLRIRAAGLTLLVVEQNIALAAGIASRCIVLGGGTIMWQGSMDEARNSEAVRKAYFD